MQIDALTIGRAYAFRERRSTASPVLKVRLLEILESKRRVKVRFEDGPHLGLEEYVTTRQLLVPWGKRKPLLRDERKAAELDEHARALADHALTEAANAVLESTGEQGAGIAKQSAWMTEAGWQRILDRAGVDIAPVDLHPLAYRDRHGRVHLPLDAVVAVAKSFAAAEPQTVVGHLDDAEERMRLEGNAPGERWVHDFLRNLRPGFALARQWAGLEQEAEMLRKEIARLRALVSNAAQALSMAGEERKADLLLRALAGH